MMELSEKLKADAEHVVENLANESFNEGYAVGYAEGFRVALKSITDFIVSGAAGRMKHPAVISAPPPQPLPVAPLPLPVLENGAPYPQPATDLPVSEDPSDYMHEKWRLKMVVRRLTRYG